MEILGYVLADDALDSHKCYVIDGDELYLLIEIKNCLSRMGKHGYSMTLNKIIESALNNELEDVEP